MGCIIKLRGYG